MKYAGYICATFSLILLAAAIRDENGFETKKKLSEYDFFTGPLAALNPAKGVVSYDLNSALFSNYAEKLRFVKLPEGTAATYNDTAVFEFPVGTVLIKNFYYPDDVRKPEKGRKIIETRLLVLESSGWSAYPYIWNEEQTEAYYDPAGETREIFYIDRSGKKVKTSYIIPNKNQCKGCHLRDQKLLPIGPAARHMNKMYTYESGTFNQLNYWAEVGLLKGLPPLAEIPKLPVWDNPATGNLEQRARAYLDINCGHCHSKEGPANTSGLFLDVHENDKGRLGVNKSPVAAGRGSGKLQFDIMPGQPQQSIMIFRMNTTDPAIAMPEIGREQIHKEGVALIAEWIRKMPQ